MERREEMDRKIVKVNNGVFTFSTIYTYNRVDMVHRRMSPLLHKTNAAYDHVRCARTERVNLERLTLTLHRPTRDGAG
jgi:hypothetical protein